MVIKRIVKQSLWCCLLLLNTYESIASSINTSLLHINTESPFKGHFAFFVSVALFFFVINLLIFLYFRKRKLKERNYFTANKWLMEVMTTLPDSIFIYNSSLQLIDYINPKDNVVFDLDLEKTRGISVFDIGKEEPALKEVALIIAENLKKTAETREVSPFVYTVNKNGKTYYTSARAFPFGKDQIICFAHDDTEAWESKQESTRLKDFFQSIVDNLPVGLLVKDVDNDFRFEFFNDYLLDFYGENNVLELGKNEREIGGPMSEVYYQEDEEVAARSEPITFERVSCDDKGKPSRWEVTTKSCFTNSNGRRYLMAVTVETTEIRKREFELEKIREALSLTLEAGNISAWYLDIDKNMYFSLYGQTICGNGKTPEEIYTMLHPEDVKIHIKVMNGILSGKYKKRRHVIRLKLENSYQWYEIYVNGIANDKGEIYQIVGTERNITEDVQKQQELINTKTKLELAFSSADIVPWELDCFTEQLSSINKEAIEASNIKLIEYLDYIHRDDRVAFMNNYENLLNGKKKGMSVEIRITFPEQEQRWYEINAIVANRNKSGNITRLIGIRKDITAAKMKDELIELHEKAEHSNRMKTAFLANMSHEIRTPLNAIVGFSQLIMQSNDQQEQESYYDIIETNNELLLQLISDILDLSKIEAGELDFVYSGFKVAEIFHTLEKVYISRVKPGVELITELPESLCLIYSDRNRVTQVVSNFLSNAIKFTEQGSITIGYSYVDSGLRFFVKDTGKGIEEKNKKEVFERFAKFDEFIQGNGLGLSICQSIIENLGGTIGVNSVLGEGSEFWFILPCEPVYL